MKEVIYFPDLRIKGKSSPPCLKPVELSFFDDAPEAEKCEHSSSQLLGSPCEGGSDAHFVGIKRVPSEWLSSASIHTFKAPIQRDCSPADKAQIWEVACKGVDYVVDIVSRWWILATSDGDFMAGSQRVRFGLTTQH